jgi:D-xylose transport system permease protein
MSTALEPAASGGSADAAEMTAPPSVGSYLRDYVDRVRGGDIGSLPAIFGLIALVAVFSALRPVFYSPTNINNLLQQGAPVAVIAMGLVFVLLLGEIDLSAGFASGVSAAVMAILMAERGWQWPLAVAGGLLTGLVIGTVIGTLVARIGIPSFVVTLAAFLGLQGTALILIGEGGLVRISSRPVLAIENSYLKPWAGWAMWAGALGVYAVVLVGRAASRRAKGLTAEPIPVLAARIGVIAALTAIMVHVLNQPRGFARLPGGVPYVVPLILLLLVGLTFVLGRTAYGRHVYAVGGNAEAARRAGINVAMIRTSVFMIGSTMAAIGGIIAASRANSVDPTSGGSDTLLYAVGAAVIGGTSLFGGKGRPRDAILGASVIAVINNGMPLLGYQGAGIKFVVTGLVLLVAASIDALSRRRAAASGKI